MKSVLTIALVAAVALTGGCMTTSPQGGGMGKDNGFKLSVPSQAVSMKQMETRAVKVTCLLYTSPSPRDRS